MDTLKLVYGCFDIGRSGVRRNGYGGLKNYAAAVTLTADLVDGYTGLCLTGCYNSFVYMASIHTFTAIFGQQRRVYVDYPLRIALQKEVRYHHQEAGQSDGIDGIIIEGGKHLLGIIDLGLCHNDHGYAERAHAFNHAGIGVVAHYECNLQATS